MALHVIGCWCVRARDCRWRGVPRLLAPNGLRPFDLGPAEAWQRGEGGTGHREAEHSVVLLRRVRHGRAAGARESSSQAGKGQGTAWERWRRVCRCSVLTSKPIELQGWTREIDETLPIHSKEQRNRTLVLGKEASAELGVAARRGERSALL